MLKAVKIIERLPKSQKEGIIGIDGKEYPLPLYEEIIAKFQDPEKRALIEKKAEQGFIKLQLTPFALSLSALIDRYKQTLLKTHQETGIRATDGTVLDLKTEDSLGDWAGLTNSDNPNTPANKQMEYGVKIYDNWLTKDGRGGRYKSELLQNSANAWQISLIEDLPDLPAENQGQIIAGRKQFEAGETPKKYLALLKEKPDQPSPYQGESGQTPESAFITCLTYLYEKKIAINYYSGKGKANWLIGSRSCYGSVPYFYWNGSKSEPCLGLDNPGAPYSFACFRPLVML